MAEPVVLIVEDSPDVHFHLRRAFPYWRYLPAVSIDAAELELQTGEQIDLVILDYQLKNGETTAALCAAIREKQPHLPIIALSGDLDGIRVLRRAGANRSVLKGEVAETREIIRVVTEVLGVSPTTPVETSPALPTSHIIAAPDTSIVEDASISDLDLALVAQHIAMARERSVYHGTNDPLTFLAEQQCIVRNTPTIAGLLLFGVDFLHLVPNAAINFQVKDAARRAPPESTFSGTLPQMIKHTTRVIWEHIEHHAPLHEFPLRAIEELTTNALCHRDWRSGGPVRVVLEKGKISWVSYGDLPSPVTVESMSEQLAPRNPTVARLLRQAGYGTNTGRGWGQMVAELEQNGNPPVAIHRSEYQVRVTLFSRPMATVNTTLGISRETAPGPDTTVLEHRRAAILSFCGQRPEGVSPKEIKQRFPEIPERTLERDLSDLVRAGMLFEEGSTRRRVYRIPTQNVA